jgi:UDP-N-acetylmuramyl pentapeptide phosphotransferase/UDP-N-acetylglucosamine-1-phosphate transferase
MIGAGAIAAFLVSCLLCKLIIRRAGARWLDHPGHRSLHAVPVPRLGGVALWCGFAVGGLLCSTWLTDVLDLYWLAGGALLWLVSLADDRGAIAIRWRLLVQLAAAMLVLQGTTLLPGAPASAWFWLPFAVLLVLWSINLYNFMDGMDGLAACMAIVGFSALGILAWQQWSHGFAVLCLLLVMATAGFLCFNFPPARLFMGDSGSTGLGFAMATVGLKGFRDGLYDWWVPLLVFSPFWLDASLTLLRRLCRGEKVWLPHRQHLYQRWVMAGCSHRQVLAAYLLVMLACAASVLIWQAGTGRYNEKDFLYCWVGFYLVVLVVSEWRLRGRMGKSGGI